jgi:hypothetical protein
MLEMQANNGKMVRLAIGRWWRGCARVRMYTGDVVE